jgi:hypothetical protein
MHVRHGRKYLAPDEYERRLAAHLFPYARALARQLPRLRDKDYRAYHREFLRELKSEVGAREVARGTLFRIKEKLRRGTSQLSPSIWL